MAYYIAQLKRARMLGFWAVVATLFAIMFPVILRAEMVQYATPGPNSLTQTIYTETPVQSYYAYPDDVNFVPAGQFMQRADSLNYDTNIDAARAAESAANPNARISFADRPTVVCRDFGCTKMNDHITRTFLFNSLANMFMLNQNSKMFLCEADPFTRACLSSGISFPTQSGIANAMVKIPDATIDGVSLSTGLSKATINVSFDFLVNGIAVQCNPAALDIVVPVNSQATLAANEFSCDMTMDGATNVSLLFNIDYIDLDYGILGGYYSLGLQGPAMGGGTGYVLMKTQFAGAGQHGKYRAGMMQQQDNDIGCLGDDATATNANIRPGEYAVEPMGN